MELILYTAMSAVQEMEGDGLKLDVGPAEPMASS
jgi:hypothetical protein